jgi:uncharacterized protein involved in type VI secretion and phage assembly
VQYAAARRTATDNRRAQPPEPTMPQSPLDASNGVPSVHVTSNGRPIADGIGLVSVHIRRAVAGIPTARLVIEDGDVQQGRWPVADGDAFEPGAVITIAAGCGSDAKTLFEGVVATLGVRIAGDNCSRFEVTCRGRAHAMTLARRNTHFADQTDSTIINRVIGRHPGLGAAVDTTALVHGGMTQCDRSDWDFIVARAEANGLVVIADDDRVRVQAPRLDGEPVLSVAWGVDLMDFHAERDAHDPGRLLGRMSFQGSALARLGALIEVSGVGARYSGKVFVDTVEHDLSQGNWTTTVGFGLAPRPQRGGQAGGLQTGIVVGVEDPAGEQRIQIRLPRLDAGAATVWARMAQFQASDGFGAIFMPEVDDEVVVGFFDLDPSQPVVLGSLYGSRRRPPHALAASNDIKTLVTRSGHRLEFDEARKVIIVTTPARNQVVLDDADQSVRLQDQHGNQVLLHRHGISLDAPQDLKISARGSIAIDALGAVTIGAGSDVRLSGLNVVCAGQVGFSGKGNATAELSAAGQTIVKGAMVMIN